MNKHNVNCAINALLLIVIAFATISMVHDPITTVSLSGVFTYLITMEFVNMYK